MKIKDMIDNQPEVLKLLKKGFDSNLLSHAYLFAGEEGRAPEFQPVTSPFP